MRTLPILLLTATLATGAATYAEDTQPVPTQPSPPAPAVSASPSPAGTETAAETAPTPDVAPAASTAGQSADPAATSAPDEATQATPAAPQKSAKPAPARNSSGTALSALDLLPIDQAANVARIEGVSTGSHNGKLTPPDRWSVVVLNEKDPNAVHEFEIVSGEIVSSHPGSQYVSELKPGDILPPDGLVIDSDQVARELEAYARANKVKLAKATYELTKDGEDAAPVWKATGFDAEGTNVGAIVITASKDTMVSHDGFAKEPVAAESPSKSPKKSTGSTRRAHRHHEQEGGVAHAFKHVGGKLEKFFTGHDTIENGN